MRDLHVNIGGPRDRARQQVSFQVAQTASRPALDVAQIGCLLGQLREALAQSQLPADERRRAERHLQTIEEESHSEKPLLSEINAGLSFLDNLANTAQGLAPLVSGTLRLLSAAFVSSSAT